MKYNYFAIGLLFLLMACEDVIDVDTPNSEPRLIVNGLIRVDENETFVPVEIKVTESSNFFEDIPATQLESAMIVYGQPDPNNSGQLLNQATSLLTELEQGSGIYVPDLSQGNAQRIRTDALLPNTIFVLVIEHKGKRFTARTPYSSTILIDNLVQGDETVFDEDDTEIKITITDTEGQKDYYVLDFGSGEFFAFDDQFIDGQVFEFSYFFEREVEPGQEIEISILGADKQFHDYIALVSEQNQPSGGFDTPTATFRGNIFEISKDDNILEAHSIQESRSFPLGYFAVVETFKRSLVIE